MEDDQMDCSVENGSKVENGAVSAVLTHWDGEEDCPGSSRAYVQVQNGASDHNNSSMGQT